MSAPSPPRARTTQGAELEARRRVFVGVGGLLLMLLLVMLAGYLSGQFRNGVDPKEGVTSAGGPGATPTAPPTEPLGDGAVDPSGVPVTVVPDAALVADGEGGMVVPDLQPDPELEATKPGR